MRFILTIDTEGDNQWDHGRDLTVENIRFVPRFQALCEVYGIKPTYLVTSEVCHDSYSKDLFGGYISDDRAEVGAHLHAWTTPPFIGKKGFRENDASHAFASELPGEILDKKISNLTDQINLSFGKRPTSFRSGRYGFNMDVARSLLRNGYITDSSITPFVSWSEHMGLPEGEGGPDFIDFSPLPFKYDLHEGSLTEIPITIMPTLFPLTLSKKLASFYFRNVSGNYALRAMRKVFYSNQPVWLRPVPGTDLPLLNRLLNVTINKQLPFITMMFHSSELMPGCSKYRPDKASVEELYLLLEDFYKLLANNGVGSLTLTEAAQSYSE